MKESSVASSVHSSAKKAAKATKRAAHKIAGNSCYKYSWEELTRIEERRRAILKRTEDPFWRILSHWDGTVLEILMKDSLFWITIVIYVGIRIWARYGIPDYVADLGSGDIAVIGGFLSFFLVFYVNQSNSRYFSLYEKSMACKGRIFDTATIVVTTLPQDVATRLIRYMNAAHVAGYTGLSETYPSTTFFAQLNKNLGLLTDDELARMMDIDLDRGGSCQRELLVWCMREIQMVQSKGVVDNELAAQLRDQIMQLRTAFAALFNAADLPIPFFYVHFICLLTALYLPLFAISAGYNAGTGSETYWTADVVAGLVVVLQAIFVIGLRILGQKMSDPYGKDLIDLSVIFYCTFTWRMSNRILAAHFPSSQQDGGDQMTGERVENDLIRDRVESIGHAFESSHDSFHSVSDGPVDSVADFDQDGLPINQLEDGMEHQAPSRQYWFGSRRHHCQ